MRVRQSRRAKAWKQNPMETRRVLKKAAEYLVAHEKCSPQEAQEWIQQEARVKRATLAKVAKAILNQESISFCHSAPI